MEKRKEQEARIKTIILNMDSSNKKCADCENENVTSVSINNGTVICSDCAEKHKHLSYWISFIKSFTEKWDDYLLKFIKNGGNSRYLKFCKDYKIENIQSIDRYKTKGVEYYRLILKSEVMGFDPPDNINVNSAGEILENIENNYPEFENYSYVKHVDLEKLEKQFEIDKKFNEENNAGLFQTFSGILGNFGKKLNEAKDNIVGKVNEKLNEEGGLMEKMKGMTEGVKNKYYQFMGKTEELNKNDNNVQKNVKENINENQNKNVENISFNDLKELKEQKNKNLTNKKIEDSNKNNKEEKIIVDDKKEETNSNEEKLDEVENQENLTNKNEETNENESEKIENKNETIDKKEEIIQQNENSNFNEEKIENNKINEEKNNNNIVNQEKQSTKIIENKEENLNEIKNEESKEINTKKNEEKNNKTKLDDILKEEMEEEHKMPKNPEEIKKKLDEIINEKEEKEKNKKVEEKKIDIKKTQTNESNRISDKEDILKKETLRSVTTSEMFLDENQLNEILGDDKEEEFN